MERKSRSGRFVPGAELSVWAQPAALGATLGLTKQMNKILKRATGLLGIASMTFSSAALAIECPTAPGNGWDVDKVREFAMYRNTKSEDQSMLCLHRGWHANDYDKGHARWNELKDVPDNSAHALKIGFEQAPCIEVDVAGMGYRQYVQNTTMYDTVLSHDAKASREMSQVYIKTFNGTDPALQDSGLKGCTLSYGNTRICNNAPTLSYNLYESTFTGPSTSSQKTPFKASGPEKPYVTGGYLRPTMSQKVGRSQDEQQDLVDVRDWVVGCAFNGKIGLIVLDAKDLSALYAIHDMIEGLYEDPDFWTLTKHFMVKTKPWKMIDPIGEQAFKNLITSFEDKGVPVIDTIVQTGQGYNSSGAVPADSEYKKYKSYYNWRIQSKNQSSYYPSIIEITAPGNTYWDPLRSGKQKIMFYDNCSVLSGLDQTLAQIVDFAERCDNPGLTKSYIPQIWGWVPLEDGSAHILKDSAGSPATSLSSTQNLKKSDGTFMFSIPFGSVVPLPFEKGRNDQELANNYVVQTVGARAITIDSVEKFHSMFKNSGVNTNQAFFLLPHNKPAHCVINDNCDG